MTNKNQVLQRLDFIENETKQLRQIINAPENLHEQINSLDDICRIAEVDPAKYQLREDETEDELAMRQAKLIAKVLNKGVVLDTNNTDQYKYFPYARITPGTGFGLSLYNVAGWLTSTFVGVRFCFATEEDAEFAWNKFGESVYSKFLTQYI